MNTKLFILVGLIALGIGGVSAIALQSHAEKTPVQPAITTASTGTSAPTQENTATDTDNIQNDSGGIEKPDTTSTVEQGNAQEHGENGTADVNEGEDGN
jgi:hypothetical protein